MKMRARARARLRPAETMKANTGNGKLAGTKERKSGHCELQRTARGKVPWISGLGKHEKRERERERGGEGNKKESPPSTSDMFVRGSRYCRKPPTLEPISTVADVSVICHGLSRDLRRASIAARNNLEPFAASWHAVPFARRACPRLIAG